MNNELALTTEVMTFEGKQFRVFMQGTNVYFKLSEVCSWLGIQRASNAKDRLQSKHFILLKKGDPSFNEVVTVSKVKGIGAREVTLLNEQGFYFLTMRSDAACKEGHIAQKFTDWVTGDLLPSLRQKAMGLTSGKSINEWCDPPKVKNSVEVVPFKERITSDDLDQFGDLLFKRITEAVEPVIKEVINSSNLREEMFGSLRQVAAETVIDHTKKFRKKVSEVREDLHSAVSTLNKSDTDLETMIEALRDEFNTIRDELFTKIETLQTEVVEERRKRNISSRRAKFIASELAITTQRVDAIEARFKKIVNRMDRHEVITVRRLENVETLINEEKIEKEEREKSSKTRTSTKRN